MSASAAQSIIDWDRSSPLAARKAIRSHGYTGYTAGIAPGYVQANVCILPRDLAEDFLLYCQRNPRPCPLIARSDAGDPRLPSLAEDLDIRTDIPRYHIFRDGEFVEEATDIRSLWRDDLVTFALGCSFSFEEALLEAGLRLKFLERNSVAGVYITSIDTVPAGPFRGPLMVTMRAFKPADAIRAIQITSRFPNVHGAPVHIGKPESIGIDLEPPLSECRRWRGSGRRAAGVLGLRAYPATGGEERKAAALHYACAVLDADHGFAQRQPRGLCVGNGACAISNARLRGPPACSTLQASSCS